MVTQSGTDSVRDTDVVLEDQTNSPVLGPKEYPPQRIMSLDATVLMVLVEVFIYL